MINTNSVISSVIMPEGSMCSQPTRALQGARLRELIIISLRNRSQDTGCSMRFKDVVVRGRGLLSRRSQDPLAVCVTSPWHHN